MFKGDFARLRELHGRVGAGKVIRRLVEGHIARVEQTAPLDREIATEGVDS